MSDQSPNDERIEELEAAIQGVQNFMQGVCFDPRVPEDTKQAIRSKIDSLDEVLGIED